VFLLALIAPNPPRIKESNEAEENGGTEESGVEQGETAFLRSPPHFRYPPLPEFLSLFSRVRSNGGGWQVRVIHSPDRG
jgi:hypothetical protein